MLSLVAAVCVGLLQGNEIPPPEAGVRPIYHWPATYGPTLSDVSMKVRVASKMPGSSGEVVLPLPSDYSGQAVIAFRLRVEPRSALSSWRWVKRPDGLNRVVNVKLAPHGGDVTVSYDARVLSQGFPLLRTQGKQFKQWLGATATVDCDSTEVRKIAEQLNSGKPEREEVAGRVVEWVAKSKTIAGAPSIGSESLARANYCAAIFRAAHIPARIVSYVPIWAQGLEAEVWLTEYQSDDGNWTMVEPLSGIKHTARNSAIVLSISSRRDESHSVGNPDALLESAPTLSTPEISSDLTWASWRPAERHTTIHVLKVFPRASNARLMPTARAKERSFAPSFYKGEERWFDEAVFAKIIAKGPINLALYLDGQPIPGIR